MFGSILQCKMKQIVFLIIHFLFLSCTNTIVAYENMNVSITQRMFGGYNADMSIYSYVVQLRNRGTFLCAAFAISVEDIIATAHCFDGLEPPYRYVTVHTGTSSPFELGTVRLIAHIMIHQDYTGNRATPPRHDIAHILLEDGSKLTLGPNQRKAELPDDDVVTGATAIMTGWGCTEESNSGPSQHLRVLEMQLLNYADCQNRLMNRLSTGHLCAISSVGHGCPSGEGGSLLVNDNVAIGIHSWCQPPACRLGEVEVFTNLFQEKGFIERYKQAVVFEDPNSSSSESEGGRRSRGQSSNRKKRGWLRKLTCTAK